jgi:hypothetical protein
LRKRLPRGLTLHSIGSKEREDDDGKESEEEGEQEEGRSGAQEEEVDVQAVGKKEHEKEGKAASTQAQVRAEEGAAGSRACAGAVCAVERLGSRQQ